MKGGELGFDSTVGMRGQVNSGPFLISGKKVASRKKILRSPKMPRNRAAAEIISAPSMLRYESAGYTRKALTDVIFDI